MRMDLMYSELLRACNDLAVTSPYSSITFKPKIDRLNNSTYKLTFYDKTLIIGCRERQPYLRTIREFLPYMTEFKHNLEVQGFRDYKRWF